MDVWLIFFISKIGNIQLKQPFMNRCFRFQFFFPFHQSNSFFDLRNRRCWRWTCIGAGQPPSLWVPPSGFKGFIAGLIKGNHWFTRPQWGLISGDNMIGGDRLNSHIFHTPKRNEQLTWRIIPVSKWLVTTIYKPFSPFGRGITLLRGLTNQGY